ncbi:MAG: type VI secretion system protein TssA [Acidobacteriota bacterium]|nr:type VI secretion system protein TssA [Acidobacteriota bacterium]
MTETVSLPQTIDIERLLTPISEDNPAGESVVYIGIYDEIREARRADDQSLSLGDWAFELKVADWRKVIQLATSALSERTKDLQIASWLAEALVKQHGFAGLRDGLILVRRLQEGFWETLFPEIDENDDLEARANALESLDRNTALAIKEVPLTSGERLNFIQWTESRDFDIPENIDALDYNDQEKYKALLAQAEEERRVTGERWRKAKAASNRAFYEELYLTIEECWSEYEKLDRTMDERFGNQTPGLGQLKKSLDAIRDLVKRLLQEKRELEPDPVADSASDEVITDGSSANGSNGVVPAFSGGAAISGAIRSRQDALKRLSEVAEFFRQTEPHSPVSYLVQRAVKWGNMPLESWLQEVVKDESVLSQIRETLGVAEQNYDNESY